MRLTVRRLAFIVVGIGLLGVVVVWSGIVGIKASSGHWAITDWVLHVAMRQSVKTYSAWIEVPSLDNPALVQRGAGHFATGCAPCHGAPGIPQSAIAREMTPRPPALSGRIDDWDPAELFWIVMHGVKFTGMPAWPAQGRDDEVWAMVAFLLELPDLDLAEYRRLAFGEAAPKTGFEALSGAGSPPVGQCIRCHGRDGAGRGSGAFPRLTGQSEDYLLASLMAYASGARHSGIMQPPAEPISDDMKIRIARHYSEARADEPATTPAASDPASLRRGKQIVEDGIAASGVPSCAACHMQDGNRRNPAYPLLGGQHDGYILDQLAAFRAGTRGGTPYAHIMATIAGRMSEQQMKDAAAYLGSLPLSEGRLR